MHCNGYNSFFFVNGTETFIFKENNGNVNFLIRFCLGSISVEFDSNDIKFSLKEHVYDFSVDYITADKSKTLNICKCSIVKNNIK